MLGLSSIENEARKVATKWNFKAFTKMTDKIETTQCLFCDLLIKFLVYKIVKGCRSHTGRQKI